jgi:hypothetical protein
MQSGQYSAWQRVHVQLWDGPRQQATAKAAMSGPHARHGTTAAVGTTHAHGEVWRSSQARSQPSAISSSDGNGQRMLLHSIRETSMHSRGEAGRGSHARPTFSQQQRRQTTHAAAFGPCDVSARSWRGGALLSRTASSSSCGNGQLRSIRAKYVRAHGGRVGCVVGAVGKAREQGDEDKQVPAAHHARERGEARRGEARRGEARRGEGEARGGARLSRAASQHSTWQRVHVQQ